MEDDKKFETPDAEIESECGRDFARIREISLPGNKQDSRKTGEGGRDIYTIEGGEDEEEEGKDAEIEMDIVEKGKAGVGKMLEENTYIGDEVKANNEEKVDALN
ncbi:hypothetical protein M8J77_026533 [Diaphorina citri]|nr:hypothetical protein M8J77_026533 [Diaphorina citri]